MPVVFAAHGAPVLLDDAGWISDLASWAKAVPRPESILMVSAHWEKRPTTLGATRTVPLVYDFNGFPERYYHTKYPAPGAHLALPTWEHNAPHNVAAGAASDERPRVTFPITGWWMESAFTRRSVQFD
jgi:aromatic ring-opening dioxygenase catalytic subunit (LigB family)